MAAPLKTFWTDKTDDLLRLHEARFSASHIAKEIGTTRNAVLGKLKRLGLLGTGFSRPRLTDEQRAESKKRQAAAKVVRRRIQRQKERGERQVQTQAIPIKAPPPFIGSLNVPFADLRPWRGQSSNQCRYIAAEIPGPDYLACGNETLPGESYCGHCKDIVFARASVAPLVPQKEAA